MATDFSFGIMALWMVLGIAVLAAVGVIFRRLGNIRFERERARDGIRFTRSSTDSLRQLGEDELTRYRLMREPRDLTADDAEVPPTQVFPASDDGQQRRAS